jgi:hypothetical protein
VSFVAVTLCVASQRHRVFSLRNIFSELSFSNNDFAPCIKIKSCENVYWKFKLDHSNLSQSLSKLSFLY